MSQQIVFSLAARTQLAQRFARELADAGCSKGLSMHLRDVEQTLHQIFGDSECVLVQHVYEGFRRRPGEYILLVEVSVGDETTPNVVKIADAERLQEELDGWESCRPRGLKHDIVLMDLEPIHDADGQLIALVYADAEQLIGVDQTLTLESAMLDAVRLGEPTVESVADVLFQIYERLGLLFYRHSFNARPQPGEMSAAELFATIDKHLPANIERWNEQGTDGFLLRGEITTQLDGSGLRERFLDPAHLFLELRGQLAESPSVVELLPPLLRGRGHGDLHGRNVLVGRVGKRVLWPAVYDFGDMGPNNVIAWDFVKLETEFKIRMYPLLFPAARFTTSVVQFECEVAEATEMGRRTDEWPALPPDAEPRQRLLWLLLQLRRMAMQHLSQSARNRVWLAEYDFLLAAYGLNSVRFENLIPVELKGAYLSAGCAAARFVD